MKIYLNLKVVVFSLLLFLFTQNLNAKSFLLSNDAVIDKRAEFKINEMGQEVKKKLGINIYVYAKNTYGIDKNIKTKEKIKLIKIYEEKLLSKLEKPYVLLTIALEQTHVNLLLDKNLETIIDKNDILNAYVVPLLASKDKNTLFAKTSAAVLNGYAAIADTLAQNKDIELESSIGSVGKTTGTIWKVFMYFLVLTGLILYVYAILKKRK